MTVKTCTKCGEEKALTEFYTSSSGKYGRRADCKACHIEQKLKYHQANRERRLEYMREYDRANKGFKSERERQYYESNKERILERQREYYLANKVRWREYEKERYDSDPLYALAKKCRRRTSNVLKRNGYTKDSTTKDMLGCTYEELMQHLESQFVDGMSWDNRSEWHIDHIIPLASANTEAELLELCHHTNLQPLWARDNLSKGARV